MYSKITNNIEVHVRPIYLKEHSAPESGHYVWAYHITISNYGNETVQLLNRYWHICDANQHIQEVRGPGVVGQQPILAPGTSYEYSSFTQLPTASGEMHGSYEMRTSSGQVFLVEIPNFPLIVACRLVEIANAAMLNPSIQ